MPGDLFRDASARLAHDFNNLLLVINCSSAQLLSHLAPDDPGRPAAVAICDAGSRGAALVRELQQWGGSLSAPAAGVDLNEVILRAEPVLHRLIPEDVAVTRNLASAALLTTTCSGQVEQALVTLVLIARCGVPVGGWLTIETGVDDAPPAPGSQSREPVTPAPRFVRLAVSHAGQPAGDPVAGPAADSRIARDLAQLSRIAGDCGGVFTVSRPDDGGTRFAVYFPAADAPRDMAAAPSRGETILLVEDRDYVRSLVTRAMESDGYTVVAAEHGPAAIAAALRHQGAIDLLVTDVILPEISGPEIAAALQQQDHRLPVLFMSGSDQSPLAPGDAGEVAAGHASDFIGKPFKIADLLSKVRRLLDNRPAVN